MLTDEALRSSPTAFIYTFAQTAPESSMCPAASQVLGTESRRNHGPRPGRASKLGWKIKVAVSVTQWTAQAAPTILSHPQHVLEAPGVSQGLHGLCRGQTGDIWLTAPGHTLGLAGLGISVLGLWPWICLPGSVLDWTPTTHTGSMSGGQGTWSHDIPTQSENTETLDCTLTTLLITG